MAVNGRLLIGIAAISTLVIPIAVDGYLLAKAHMNNPLWLPHAKLHCAMSFFGAVGLGLASLWLLRTRPANDLSSMALAAFTGTVFWAGLIAAGFWPGTSYNFEGDPANYMAPPVVLGVPLDLNVVCAVISVVIGWTGFILLTRTHSSVTAN